MVMVQIEGREASLGQCLLFGEGRTFGCRSSSCVWVEHRYVGADFLPGSPIRRHLTSPERKMLMAGFGYRQEMEHGGERHWEGRILGLAEGSWEGDVQEGEVPS